VAVARSACRLKWVRLSTVPPAERADALRVQALAWRPFDDCAQALVLQGDTGLVAAWDRAAATAQLSAAGLDPQRCRLVPEPLLRKPADDGLHLLQAVEGFEAQQWSEGQLRASRWWAQMPSEADWQDFLRSLPGEQRQHERPAAAEQPWLKRPWADLLPGAESAGDDRRREARLVWLAAAAFALAAGFAAAQTFIVERAISAQRATNDELRQRLEPVLRQRERALAQAAQAEVWAAWLRAPLPVELIQHLHDTLARRQVMLKEFELNSRKLRLGLQPPAALPRAELLKALSAGGWFTELAEARTEGAREGLWLEAKLSGPELPAAPSAPVPPTLAAEPAPGPAPAAPVFAPAPNAPAPVAQPVRPAPPPPRQAQRPASDTDMPPASVFDAIK
jgi:hypothetical protein